MTKAAALTAPPAPWRNRIVGTGEEAPGDLIPNERNWRIHPAAQQGALASVLDDVGWVGQVLVNRRTGHLVDGHLRVELALSRQEPSVPVTYVDLSEDEEALVLASLDPLAGMAVADAGKLRELLEGVTISSDDLAAMLASLMPKDRTGRTDPDEVPEVPVEPYVQPGELWLLGDHRLLCGDATEPAAVARLLDGAEPALLATDPPYGVSLDPTWRDGVYNGLGPAEKPYMRVDGRGEPDDGTRAPVARAAGRTKGHRNTTLSGDTRVDWSEAFALVPSLKVGYVWHAGVHAAAVADGLVRIGFEMVSQVIWGQGPLRPGPLLVPLAPRALLGGAQAGVEGALPGRAQPVHRLGSAQPQDDHVGLQGGQGGPPRAEAGDPGRDAHRQPPQGGRGGVRPLRGLGHDHHRG